VESSVRRQRYESRSKKNGNRLRNNRVPSVKENDPIPKEKHCLEPLKKINTKDDKENDEYQCQSYFAPIRSQPGDQFANNQCNRAYKSSGMQVGNDAIQGGS